MSCLATKMLKIWISNSHKNTDFWLLLENVNIWAALSQRYKATVTFGWSMYNTLHLGLHRVTSFKHFTGMCFCKHFNLQAWCQMECLPPPGHLPLWRIEATAGTLSLDVCVCGQVTKWALGVRVTQPNCMRQLSRGMSCSAGAHVNPSSKTVQVASVEPARSEANTRTGGVRVHPTHSAQCASVQLGDVCVDVVKWRASAALETC